MELEAATVQRQELTMAQLQDERATVHYFLPSHALHVARDLVYRKLSHVKETKESREGLVRYAARDVITRHSPALLRWMAENREAPFGTVISYLSDATRRAVRDATASVWTMPDEETGTSEHMTITPHTGLNMIIVGHTCNVTQLHINRLKDMDRHELKRFTRHISEVRGWTKDIARRTIMQSGPALLKHLVEEREEPFGGVVESLLDQIRGAVGSQCSQRLMHVESTTNRH